MNEENSIINNQKNTDPVADFYDKINNGFDTKTIQPEIQPNPVENVDSTLSNIDMSQPIVEPVPVVNPTIENNNVLPNIDMSQPIVEPVPIVNPAATTNPTDNIFSDINSAPIQTVNDDELLKAYIGKNYDKIIGGGFNIGAFISSSIYLFYRKMFWYAILLFIVNIILLNIEIPGIQMIISVLMGFFMNKFYVKISRDRIEKIKQENSGASQNELIDICSKKGGTSVGKIFLGMFTQFILAIIILFIMIFAGLANGFIDLLKNLEFTEESVIEEPYKYNDDNYYEIDENFNNPESM